MPHNTMIIFFVYLGIKRAATCPWQDGKENMGKKIKILCWDKNSLIIITKDNIMMLIIIMIMTTTIILKERKRDS